MSQAMVECVPNMSEGRELWRIDQIQNAIAAVPGTIVLHRTSDADHNRSVITFAAPVHRAVDAAVAAVAKSAELINLNEHRGVHPRVGALDVLPFVPLAGTSMETCIALAHEAGERIWRELRIPVYFYEQAALRPERKRLERVRKGQFEALRHASSVDPSRAPDLGGPGLHATAGAVVIGARKFLIAFNINLNSNDLDLAKSIALRIRESGGGLPGVKALGLPLATRDLVQVSMNITDHEAAPLHVVYRLVEQLASAAGVAIAESELIGLLPRAALEAAFAGFLKLPDFRTGSVIENRIEQLAALS